MEQIPSCEANYSSATKGISPFMEPEFYYRVYKNSALEQVLSYINPVHTLIPSSLTHISVESPIYPYFSQVVSSLWASRIKAICLS
jgi:hypothetical protein